VRRRKAKKEWNWSAAPGVSTREERQVFDRQMDALKASGCTHIFEDRGSGASSDRPGVRARTDNLDRDDVLVVLDLDRPGRLAGELIRLVDDWKRAALVSARCNSWRPACRCSCSRLMWFLGDVIGSLSENVVPFSFNVVPDARIFSANLVPKIRCNRFL
jgi:Resolvase, N terminal domain